MADQGPVKKPRGKGKPATEHQERKPAPRDLNLVSMEVKACRTLRGLKATPLQLTTIARLAKNTVGRPNKREPAKAANSYIETLTGLREALIANDEGKIESLKEKLDDLEAKDAPDLDDDIEITDAAEIEAARLLDIFGPRQIVAYADMLGDDLPDPVQSIVDGLDEGRQLKGEEWQAARDELADRIAWVVCGMNGENTSKLEEQLSRFLERKHGEEGKSSDRESEIRKLVGSPGPVVVLRNVLEHELAELLSNPQLPRATRECLRGHGAQIAADEESTTQAPEKPKNNRRPAPPVRKAGNAEHNSTAAALDAARKGGKAEHHSAAADLDEVLKAPEKYEGQDLRFENITITGTAPSKRENLLWLEVKTASGETVRAAMRDQKLTFVVAKTDAPESITQMASGSAVSATITCHLGNAPQRKHWMARVRRIELNGKN